MNAILFAAAGNAESAGWGRFVVSCEEGSLRVLSGRRLQVKDSGVKQGRPNSISIAVSAVKCDVYVGNPAIAKRCQVVQCIWYS